MGAAFLALSLMIGCGDKAGGGNGGVTNASAGSVSNPVPAQPGAPTGAIVTSTPPVVAIPPATPLGGSLINGTNPIPHRP